MASARDLEAGCNRPALGSARARAAKPLQRVKVRGQEAWLPVGAWQQRSMRWAAMSPQPGLRQSVHRARLRVPPQEPSPASAPPLPMPALRVPFRPHRGRDDTPFRRRWRPEDASLWVGAWHRLPAHFRLHSGVWAFLHGRRENASSVLSDRPRRPAKRSRRERLFAPIARACTDRHS